MNALTWMLFVSVVVALVALRRRVVENTRLSEHLQHMRDHAEHIARERRVLRDENITLALERSALAATNAKLKGYLEAERASTRQVTVRR